VGIHRILHSTCCFLNTNTAITRQLIRTARTLEAEWWHVCREAWVWGQRKMSQVLGAFGLLDFIMLRPVLAWRAFWNLWIAYFLNFPIFLFAPKLKRGQLKPRIRSPPVLPVSHIESQGGKCRHRTDWHVGTFIGDYVVLKLRWLQYLLWSLQELQISRVSDVTCNTVKI